MLRLNSKVYRFTKKVKKIIKNNPLLFIHAEHENTFKGTHFDGSIIKAQ